VASAGEAVILPLRVSPSERGRNFFWGKWFQRAESVWT